MQTAKQRQRSNKLISNIDIVGFSSVLLVLLYLLIGPYTQAGDRPSHDVNVVKVDHPVEMPDADSDDAILIVIVKDGRVYWGNDQVETPFLPMKIKDRINQGSPKIVYFKVDQRTKYGDMKGVLDAVRMTGLEKIAFLVEKQRSSKL